MPDIITLLVMQKRLAFYLLCCVVIITGKQASGQIHVRDSCIGFSMISPSYAMHVPLFDMKDRFGISNTIGAGFGYKTNRNWYFGIEGNFIFSDKIKNEKSILANISTSDGHIIDKSGIYANIVLLERGYDLMVKTGKIFPLKRTNPNSGLMFTAGGGFLQHKIRIENSDNAAPQVAGDYKKGYDHLCNGPAVTQFLGYVHFSNARKINYYAGIEAIEAFTGSRRTYYFAEMTRPNEKRFDMLIGLKVGWTFPLYSKVSREFYYY